jgi:D-alanyl-D-alanine carboxypeptidase
MLVTDVLERATGRTFASLVDSCIIEPLRLRRTSLLQTIDDLSACVAGFGGEVTDDGSTVDVRGRYHPGWCAPRVMASTAADVTCIFDALFSGRLLRDESLRRMLTLVPLPWLREAPLIIDGGMGLYSNSASLHGRNYEHGGSGPGYDLWTTIYPETPIGRVAVAVFVDTSRGPRAVELEDAVVRRVLT